MNKIFTKLRHTLPSICEIEINRKNINPSAANLIQCIVPLSSHKLHNLFLVCSSLSESHNYIFWRPLWPYVAGSRLMVAPALPKLPSEIHDILEARSWYCSMHRNSGTKPKTIKLMLFVGTRHGIDISSRNSQLAIRRITSTEQIISLANKYCLWKKILSQNRIRHVRSQSIYFAYKVGIISSYSNTT